MSARLVLVDEPGAWVDFTTGGRSFRARFDPMWLGAEKLAELLEKPRLVWQLLDEKSRARAMTHDLFGRHTLTMLKDYLDTVGLGFEGLVEVMYGLEHLDELEVDLLRMGLEVRDWLTPEGSLSSRRMMLVIRDLKNRPESAVGAVWFDLKPIDKAGLVAAQYVSTPEKPHRFLKSPAEIQAEVDEKREQDAKIARVQARGF